VLPPSTVSTCTRGARRDNRATFNYQGSPLNKLRLIKALAAIGLATSAASSFAGRPLLVDDAGVNKKGEGHIETWITRADGDNAFTVSPAYAFWDTVELAGAYTHFDTAGARLYSLQAKWMITPSQDHGCNFAAAVVGSRFESDVGNGDASTVTGLFSCNGNPFGNIHINLGYTKPSGASGDTSYGVAIEKSFGVLTPHVELVGSDNTDSIVNLGLRGDIARNVQLDGSIGRQSGINIYTVGLKFRF